MDINRFTEKAREGLAAAQTLAVKNGHQQVDVEHLLLALLEQDRGLAGSILHKAEVDPASLADQVQKDLDRLPKVSGTGGSMDQIYISSRLNSLLVQAEDEARKLKDEFISVEHLLLSMTDDRGITGRVLKQFGITRERLMQALREVRGTQRVVSQNPRSNL